MIFVNSTNGLLCLTIMAEQIIRRARKNQLDKKGGGAKALRKRKSNEKERKENKNEET